MYARVIAIASYNPCAQAEATVFPFVFCQKYPRNMLTIVTGTMERNELSPCSIPNKMEANSTPFVFPKEFSNPLCM